MIALKDAAFAKLPIKAVFTDLDGTITDSHGSIGGATYQSLCRLKQKYNVVVVSGRPAGWADCLMRIWPIDAMVFENGAGVLFRSNKRTVEKIFAKSEEKKILDGIFKKLKKTIPRIKLASDQRFRRFDYAIDYAEEPPCLTKKETQDVLDFLKKQKGITAKLSSIHINYWCGQHTKVTAIDFLLEKLSITKKNVVYCGDSPNDEPLFEFFPHSVGMANIAAFEGQMHSLPAYVTNHPFEEGFVEFVNLLLRQDS